MGWTPQILSSGTLGTSTTTLFAPKQDTIVRGIQVVNTAVSTRTCTLYLVGSIGTVGIGTPSIPLGASESFIYDEPVTLRGGVDSITGVASVGSSLTYAIWGVVKQ